MKNTFVHKDNSIRRKAGGQNVFGIAPFSSGLFSYKPNYKPIYTHPKIIEYFVQKNNISVLAFYYKLKQHYKNSVVYNWNANKVAKRCGVSHPTSSKYSKQLVEYELAEWTKKGHLRLKSMKKIFYDLLDTKYHKGWVEIKVSYNTKLRQIIDILREVSTRKLLSNQEFYDKMKVDYQMLAWDEPLSEGRIKQIERHKRENSEEFEKPPLYGTIVGMRRLGREVGLSHYGASKFLERLRKRKLVKTSVEYRYAEEIERFSTVEEYSAYFEDYPGWFYRCRNGRIGVIYGTRIEFIC
jgi:hypothetical protein